MKKALNAAKAALFAATLLVTGLTAFPQMAKAWTIVIHCDGSNNLCATVTVDDGIPINFWLGNATSIDIYPD